MPCISSNSIQLHPKSWTAIIRSGQPPGVPTNPRFKDPTLGRAIKSPTAARTRQLVGSSARQRHNPARLRHPLHQFTAPLPLHKHPECKKRSRSRLASLSHLLHWCKSATLDPKPDPTLPYSFQLEFAGESRHQSYAHTSPWLIPRHSQRQNPTPASAAVNSTTRETSTQISSVIASGVPHRGVSQTPEPLRGLGPSRSR